jgi:hypothetical protein
MRFSEFLRTTVLTCAAAASALAVVAVAGASNKDDDVALAFAAAWWVIAAITGGWLGRRAGTSASIAALLAGARTQASLPHVTPARIVLNRLWPLVVVTLGAGAVAFLVPQVPIIGAGFAMLWALAWRRQASAVTAIEERDGARFYVEPTSPLRPIRLVRTPGFRSNRFEMNGAGRSARRPRPRV